MKLEHITIKEVYQATDENLRDRNKIPSWLIPFLDRDKIVDIESFNNSKLKINLHMKEGDFFVKEYTIENKTYISTHEKEHMEGMLKEGYWKIIEE